MNIIDIIVIVCCVPAVIRGLSKGFVNQAYSLLALIIGVWLSFKFSAPLGDALMSYVELSPTILHVIAFGIILLIVMLLVTLVGKAVEKVLKFVMLGWLNKILGVVFALIKVFLIIGLVITLFDAINSNIPLVKEQVLNESLFYHPVKNLADTVFPYLKELIFKK
ncbi:MAG: CvpA family protein [Bacteroidales bacterium]|nr:CvpA family protein [Bacteroidales bacterium]MBP3269237.1 CvpA family protein [Bacteroidales bacterium]